MKNTILKIAAVVLLLFTTVAQGAVWNIVYPRPLSENDARNQYPLKLLSLALEQTGVNFKLSPSEKSLIQSKGIKMLESNRGINLIWSMTDEEREVDLLPIRIPIYKGLIGWRVLLIKSADAKRFSALNRLQKLRNYTAVQGQDWPDTKILQANGFSVAGNKDYQSLFNMLDSNNADFFPRSIIEVHGELKNPSLSKSIVLAENVGLRYPAAMYFFVNKNNKVLANLIQTGLEKAIENGQFDQLFIQQHGPVLQQLEVGERRFFDLDNPLLPKKTPLNRKVLWFRGGNVNEVEPATH